MGLDSVELVMGFEERFGIVISDEEAITLITPAAVIDLIAKKIPFDAETADQVTWTRDQIASEVKFLVMAQLGIKEADYWEEAEFVRDLGVD